MHSDDLSAVLAVLPSVKLSRDQNHSLNLLSQTKRKILTQG